MPKKYIKWVPNPKLLQRISKLHVRLFRATGGLVGRRLDGMDVLLLTTRGRKTGLARTAPLPYFRHGDSAYVVVGSNGGGDTHPAWYFNLRHTPTARVELGRQPLEVTARVLTGAERDGVWRNITADQPRYANYQQKTARQIPLVALEPAVQS